MNSILFTLNDPQAVTSGREKFFEKRIVNLLVEATISVELAEPAMIKNEPIESEQVCFPSSKMENESLFLFQVVVEAKNELVDFNV